MSKYEISATAAATALLRAVACYETAAISGLKWRDNLAHIFLDEEKRGKLASEAYRKAVKARAKDGLFAYLIARTAYFDSVFLNAPRDDAAQIVILGAGFDTRAYRYSAHLGKTKVFEIDAPATQAYKRDILSRHGLDASKVEFIALDFEKDDMRAQLIHRGFAAKANTCWLWEGVTPYLTAAEATLAAIAALTERGILAFDYLVRPVGDEETISRQGETVHFGLAPEQMDDFLRRFGFTPCEHIGAEAMSALFLTGPDGSVFGDIKRSMAFVKAEKAGV